MLEYLEFLALLFLPGIALFELFRVGEGLSFVNKLGLSLGLGMSADVLLLMIRTSGVDVAGATLNGIFPNTLYLILGAPAALLVGSIAYHRRVALYAPLSRYDAIVLLLVAAQSLLVYIHFSTFPIFPEFQSVDFGQHVLMATSLQNGAIASIPSGVLYEGVHLLLASMIALSNGEPLLVTQYGMWVLVALSPLLFYASVHALTRSEKTALIASAVYVGGGAIWFDSVFNSGLYPNFYGFLSMFLVLAWIPLLRRPGRGQWLLFALITFNGYFSHYTFLTLLPAFLVLPVAEFLTTRKVSKNTVGILAVLYVPAAAAMLALPSLPGQLFALLSPQGGAAVTGGTQLSAALAFFPFLQYIATETFNDVGTVLLLLMFAVGVYIAARRKDALLALPIIWFAVLALVSPPSLGAWRYSFVGLVPLTIVASVGIERVTASRRSIPAVKRTKGRRSSGRGWTRPLLLVLILVAIFGTSWGVQIISAAVSYPQTGLAQVSEYQSMLWIKQNTPADAVIISVTDQDYRYIQLVTGRVGGVAPLVTPKEGLFYARNVTHAYFVVTQYATVAGTAEQISAVSSQYQTAAGYSLIYQNTDVSLYLRG